MEKGTNRYLDWGIMKDNKNAFLCVCILVIILPILYYSLLSIPHADDFSYASNTRDCMDTEYSHIQGTIGYLRYEYSNWGGDYTSAILNSFFSPLLWVGYKGVPVFNLVANILFYASLFFFIQSMCSEFCTRERIHVSLLMYASVLMWITNNYRNRQIYTWYTGICAYVLPLAFVIVGIGAYLRHIHKGGLWTILSAVFGFLACGANLNLVALNIILYAIVGIYEWSKRGIKNRSLIVYFGILIGTLCNVIAPGNYVRHSYGGDDWNILHTTIVTMWAVMCRLFYLATKTPFLAMLVLVTVVVFNNIDYRSVSRIRYNRPIIVFLLCYIGVFMVDFPYVLGSHVDSYMGFDDRILFVQDMAIYIFALIWVVYFVCSIKKKNSDFVIDERSILSTVVVTALVSFVMLGARNPDSYTTKYMISRIVDGNAKGYSDYQKSILDELENSEAEEVLIQYDIGYSLNGDVLIPGLGLSDDESKWDYWHNGAIARFYKKKSVDIVIDE